MALHGSLDVFRQLKKANWKSPTIRRAENGRPKWVLEGPPPRIPDYAAASWPLEARRVVAAHRPLSTNDPQSTIFLILLKLYTVQYENVIIKLDKVISKRRLLLGHLNLHTLLGEKL